MKIETSSVMEDTAMEDTGTDEVTGHVGGGIGQQVRISQPL